MVSRLSQGTLEIEPNFAAFDFVVVGPFMQPALAAHFMLEVFHGVGDEGFGSFDAGVLQRLIKDAAGGPDERFAGEVFFVARLFADQHERRMARSLAGRLPAWRRDKASSACSFLRPPPIGGAI